MSIKIKQFIKLFNFSIYLFLQFIDDIFFYPK